MATFGFWAENKEGIKSTAFSLTFRVVGGAVTTISGAYLAPSIGVDKSKVSKGEIVNIFGQSIPNADIYIYVNSESEIIKQVETDNIGAYLLPMNTEVLGDEEFHLAKSLFQVNDGSGIVRSGFSNSVSFYVGSKGTASKCAGADLNGDKRVNLTDFSILLYNWGTNILSSIGSGSFIVSPQMEMPVQGQAGGGGKRGRFNDQAANQLKYFHAV